MKIGSVLENQKIEKRISITPEIAKKYISIGFDVHLSKKNYKFFEVPITYFGRSYEEGKKIGLKDAFIALKAIIFYSFTK